MTSDVLIVGAGPGGLAAAMLLANAGLSVRVIERQPRIGGRNAAINAHGFRFDVGPTFFLYSSVLESIFTATGRSLNDYVSLVKLDPQYRLVYGGGGELIASPQISRLKEAVARLSPTDAAQIDRFMSENRRKLELFKPCLESAFLGLRDVVNWRMLKLLPSLRPWNSLDRELSRYFKDERVRLAFAFQSKYLGMSPAACPGLFSILSFLEYEYGVHHPIGGCAAVPEAMSRVLAEMNVPIHLDEEVTQVLFEGTKAVGVRTPEGEYRAEAVVINADFADAMRRLVPDAVRSRWTDRKLSGKKFSCSTFMMYLGIDGRFDHLQHHNIYLARDYWRNLEDIEPRHVLSDDPSFYVQNATVTDPGLAPSGKSTLYVLAPVTHQHDNVSWPAQQAKFRRTLLDQLPKLGFEDVEKRIVFEKVITPDDWAAQRIHRGATFNLAHSFSQMLHLRPRNKFEDVDGVYLVGGGTHPGSGLPVIFESAKITSKLILRDLGRRGSSRPSPRNFAIPEPALR